MDSETINYLSNKHVYYNKYPPVGIAEKSDRMSRRVRKSERKSLDPSVIEQAQKLIAEGASRRQVAIKLGMPESSLRKRLAQGTLSESLGRFRCTFTIEMEEELLELVHNSDSKFFGVTGKNLRSLAYEFAEQNNIEHQFNKHLKMAGKDWLRGFKKRHPSLLLKRISEGNQHAICEIELSSSSEDQDAPSTSCRTEISDSSSHPWISTTKADSNRNNVQEIISSSHHKGNLEEKEAMNKNSDVLGKFIKDSSKSKKSKACTSYSSGICKNPNLEKATECTSYGDLWHEKFILLRS